MILVDTNILLRLADPISADCAPARKAVQMLRQRGHVLAIAPQVLYEFWTVATRPAGKPPLGSNGLGMSANRADQWLGYVLRVFQLLPDHADLHVRWRALVRTFNITGVKAHDARHVAAMQGHNLTEILTLNIQDFKRFPNITLLDPRAIS